jgi:hypothetical protein
MSAVRRFLGLCVLFAAFPAPTSAQCTPDGLDGPPCCALATPKLPKFPVIAHPALGICFLNCGIDAVQNHQAVWKLQNAAPAIPGTTGSACTPRWATLDLLDTSGNLVWNGRFRTFYSRTWSETTASGTPQQVWRFLVNGDLVPSPLAGTVPCPVPPCVLPIGRARFSGYIDWAFDCASLTWESAWMLTHACDSIDHNTSFPRGGTFHPSRSYSFVGPSVGFVPNPLVAGESGGAGFEASRRLLWPAAGTTGPVYCEAEEGATNNLLGPTALCYCSLGPGQWNNAQMFVLGACGTTLTPGSFVFPGFLSMGIGSWTNPAVYPGLENVRWNVTEYLDTDPCTGITLTEFCFGVTTLGGNPATQVNTASPNQPLPLTFIDQASSIRLGGGPLLNLPYLTDHVVNLNL